MAGIIEADLAERVLAWVLPAPIRSSGLMLIAVNLVPLYGVTFWHWPIFYVMTLYWAENVIAGFYTLLRMIAASPIAGLFMGAFFTFHYGMFCAVHGVFVNALFNTGIEHHVDLTSLPHIILSTPTLFFASLLMWVSHGWSFIGNFLMRQAEDQDVRRIMMRPYGRMVLLHVTIIFGGMLTAALGTPVAALVLLILVKTAIDFGLHRRANVPKPAANRLAAPSPGAGPAAPLPPHEHPFEISAPGRIVPSPRGNQPPTQ